MVQRWSRLELEAGTELDFYSKDFRNQIHSGLLVQTDCPLHRSNAKATQKLATPRNMSTVNYNQKAECAKGLPSMVPESTLSVNYEAFPQCGY